MPRLHPGQASILPGLTRFNVLACGRRFGKTRFGVHRLIDPALRGYPVGWFAPAYKYLYEAWDEFERRLGPVLARSNKSEGIMHLVTGGRVDFWSLKDNPDAGRSRKYRRVAVDEAAKAPNLGDAWNKAIRPTLADYRGDADFYSTPKGHDFFWQLYERGISEDHPAWASFRRPTSENPLIHPDEIEEARRQLPERVFQQEYLSEFLDDAGGVFRGVRDAIDPGRRAAGPDVGRSYVAGVDLARVEDFSVVSVLERTGSSRDGAAVQVRIDRFHQISWERQVARIKALCDEYDCPALIDSTGVGDPVYEQLRKAGVRARPYTLTNQSKEAAIDNLALMVERGRLRLLDEPTQTAELLAYQYELTASRNVRMGAPANMHDDTVIALALAAWQCGTGRREVAFY